ncbi:methyltransferase domain-containing protein [Candidatus Bathyarchaeota archaeon]|nr:methyltransferase domain-containing protein [Candidatus Bathyarchaeota archaeon]
MDRQKEFYEMYWNGREKVGYHHGKEGYTLPHRLDFALNLILEEITQADHDMKILDIGCGDGAIGMLLKQVDFPHHLHVHGVDISERALELASAYYTETRNVNVDNIDLGTIFQGEKFNIIVCMEVLEHIFHPKRLLRGIHGLLTTGGFAILSIPNEALWIHRLKLLRGRLPDSHLICPGEHIQRFTLATFSSLLSQCGFKIASLHPDLAIPRGLKIFRRILKRFPSLFASQIVVKAVPVV